VLDHHSEQNGPSLVVPQIVVGPFNRSIEGRIGNFSSLLEFVHHILRRLEEFLIAQVYRTSNWR
jgi:hypothetical protein